jgi:hypothetical protein
MAVRAADGDGIALGAKEPERPEGGLGQPSTFSTCSADSVRRL